MRRGDGHSRPAGGRTYPFFTLRKLWPQNSIIPRRQAQGTEERFIAIPCWDCFIYLCLMRLAGISAAIKAALSVRLLAFCERRAPVCMEVGDGFGCSIQVLWVWGP